MNRIIGITLLVFILVLVLVVQRIDRAMVFFFFPEAILKLFILSHSSAQFLLAILFSINIIRIFSI